MVKHGLALCAAMVILLGIPVHSLDASVPQETAEGTILHPSSSTGGKGDPHAAGSRYARSGIVTEAPSARASFGTDILVPYPNGYTLQKHPSMASDSSGNLYLAWQDQYLDKDYIQLYWSSNGGETWLGYGYITSPTADLQWPSLAVGEGVSDVLLLAYIVDNGVDIPYPEVATTPLGLWDFTFHSIPYWTNWEGYARPVIWTDSYKYSAWKAYLTCMGIFEEAVDNINVCFFRSTDYGSTWGNGKAVFGASDLDAWLDPDGSFGTTLNRLFLACFNDTDDTLYCAYSDDSGVTFEAPIAIHTMTEMPSWPVGPEIEAAKDHDNVMVCCTKSLDDDDNVAYTYSMNAGLLWTGLESLSGYDPDFNEFQAALLASEGGDSWHLAYSKQSYFPASGWHDQVYYSQRPQDLSSGWQTTPDEVDDIHDAYCPFDSKKTLACNWSTDVPGIAWADFRDRQYGYNDRDIYFDYAGNTIDVLATSKGAIWASTPSHVEFFLKAGSANAYRYYLILGSISGTFPGFDLPGGLATMPLIWDPFTDIVFNNANSPAFYHFMWKLSYMGEMQAMLVTGTLPPSVVGLVMYYAFCLNNPFDFVSNPVEIKINP